MSITITINRKKILTYVIFITFVLTLWAPTTSGSTLGSPMLKSVTRMLYFVLAVVIALMTEWKHKFGLTQALIALTPIVNFLLGRFWVYDGMVGGSVSSLLICILVALQRKDVQKEVYKLIKCFLVVTAVIGIICYVSYVFNLGLPYEVTTYYSNRRGQWYVTYKVCYLYLDTLQVRLCGLFNEPGWFGTFLAFVLCTEDLNLKKKSNVIMFIAGFFTWSLAYVLILVLYYILNKATDWKKWGVLLICVFIYIFIIPNIKTGNEDIDRYIARMVITEDGIAGDNRTTDIFDKRFANFIESKSIFLGKGSGYASFMSSGTICSIKADFVNYGLIGTFIKYVPIFGLLMYQARKNKKIIVFLLCVIASLYQRPWIFEVSNFILTLSAVAYMSDKEIPALFRL